MSEAFPQPPELSEIYCRLGPHQAHPWTPLPWPGISNKVLLLDHLTGATIELARLEAGAIFPAHYHTTLQTLFLLSGRLRSGDTLIEEGTFNVIPPGRLHGPFIAEEESIQFKYFSAIPVYILEDGSTYIYKRDGRTLAAGKLELSEALPKSSFILTD